MKNIPQSVGPIGAAMMRVSRKQAECLVVGDLVILLANPLCYLGFGCFQLRVLLLVVPSIAYRLIGDPLAGSATGLTRVYLFSTFEEGLANLGVLGRFFLLDEASQIK